MGNKSNPAILFFYAPELLIELQKNTFWEFGNKEDHFKYRNAVMQTYKYGNLPVFDGCNHMQYLHSFNSFSQTKSSRRLRRTRRKKS